MEDEASRFTTKKRQRTMGGAKRFRVTFFTESIPSRKPKNRDQTNQTSRRKKRKKERDQNHAKHGRNYSKAMQ